MENYKEKYKQALERAKKLYEQGTITESLGFVFPELIEDEDERTRKEILNVFKQLDEGTTICGRNYDYAKWIAWLEKQGEQKQTWKPSAAQLIVIKSLIEDKNTSKVDKVVLRGMFDEFKQICDAKNEIEKQCND